ncbi:acyl--CoA ligase [bacterium]|nr:acyl--CoA ligase [bacterium]
MKLRLAFTIILAAAVLTACFDYRESWVYDKEGNATVHIVCALSEDFLKKNPGITLEEERLLLVPFWASNNFPANVTLLRSALVSSNSHLALDIKFKGAISELAQLPFFRHRTINVSAKHSGMTIMQRFDLGQSAANLPCDGTVEFSQTFPGNITGANIAFNGKTIKKKIKLSEFQNDKQLLFSATCVYPERWPWKETLYVALCFLAFFLFARYARNKKRLAPRDPAPIPGDVHNIPDLMMRAASLFTSLPAVRDVTERGSSELTFHWLRANANRVSHYLIEKGLRTHDKVALLVPNGRWRHIAALGVLGAGGVMTFLDMEESPEKLADTIKRLNISFLIVSEAYQATASEMLLLSLPLNCVLWLRGDLEKNILPNYLLEQPTSAPLKALTREDPAVLLPGDRDIILTHGQILSQLFSAAQTILPDARDVLFTTFAPASIESLSFTLFLPLATASCVINLEKNDLDLALEALRKEGVTIMLTDIQSAFALSSRFRKLVKDSGGFVKRIRFARYLKNFKLPHVKLLSSLKEKFGIKLKRVYILDEIKEKRYYFYAPMYGVEIMTGYARKETAGIVLLSTALRTAYGAQGAPLPNIQVKVLGQDGKALPKGQEGFLAFRGPAVIKSFYRKGQNDDAIFRNGWYVTETTAKENSDGTVTIIK